MTTAVLLIMGATGTTAADAVRPRPPAPAASAAATLPPLPEQLRYRAELGLPADAGFVTDLNERWTGGALDGASGEGAVFTAAEEEDLDTREEAARDIQRAADRYFTGGLADAYAGQFIDHQTGKTMVLVTRDAAAHDVALRRRTSFPDRVATRQVRYPLADLTRVSETLVAARKRLAASGAAMSYVDTDVRNNRVVYALGADTAEARAAVLATLPAADARMVMFMESGPLEHTGVDGLNAPPLKGGQRITQMSTDGSGRYVACTSAFIGYERVRTDAAIYLYEYELITAGHCDTYHGVPWQQALSYPVGSVSRSAYYDLGSDAMSIPINAADRSQKVAITSIQDRIIYARQNNTDDQLSERVCMSGATTGGEICGTLLSKTLTAASDGRTFRGLRVVSFISRQGDSGGAVLHNSMAKGIVSGNVKYTDGKMHMVYPHIHTALQRLALTDVHGVG